MLILLAFEALVLGGLCDYDGFMTPHDFCVGVGVTLIINTLIAWFLRRNLPIYLWQVMYWTVACLWLAWHNPNPARLCYWMMVDRLHVGMSLSELREVVGPYPFVEGEDTGNNTEDRITHARRVAHGRYTGTLTCRTLSQDIDVTTLTIKRGIVTDVQSTMGRLKETP